jgi:hypothetical protein
MAVPQFYLPYAPSTEERIIKEVTDTNNILTFPTAKTAAAAKDPNDPNWLYPLPKGTKFLVQNKLQSNDFSLGEFRILNKKTDVPAVLLYSDLNQEVQSWVDSRRFCRMWNLFTIVSMGEEEEQEE